MGLRYVSHDFSNHARYTMLRDTLTMIAQKPLAGWGYGGFEYSFHHLRQMQTPPVVITEITRHPHNELLLWWVEGGLIALLGMLLLLACGLRLAITALRGERAENSRFMRPVSEATALCVVLLPVLLHTQTEYPFTLSAAQWAICLLLLALLDRQTHALLTFNHTRDARLLDGYARWARTYLSRRINVYAAWIAIAQSRQDTLIYRRLLQEAHTLFPEDTRFIPQGSHPQQEVAR